VGEGEEEGLSRARGRPGKTGWETGRRRWGEGEGEREPPGARERGGPVVRWREGETARSWGEGQLASGASGASGAVSRHFAKQRNGGPRSRWRATRTRLATLPTTRLLLSTARPLQHLGMPQNFARISSKGRTTYPHRIMTQWIRHLLQYHPKPSSSTQATSTRGTSEGHGTVYTGHSISI
jgi:hypothetical protein